MRRKVIAASLFICLLFVLFGIGSLVTLSSLRSAIEQMQSDNEAIRLFGTFDASIVRAAGEAASFINTHNDMYAAEALEALNNARHADDQLATIINKDNTVAHLGHLNQHRKLVVDQLEQHITSSIQDVNANRDDTSRNQEFLGRIYSYESEAIHMRAEMDAYLASQHGLHQDAVNRSLRVLVILRVVFLFIFLLILLGAFIMVQNRVVKPLNLLSDAASRVANGNLDGVVAEANNDEMGVLQRAFNKMILDLRGAFHERDIALEQSLRDKDAAEAASRAKSTFLANMSHELRTPLTAISGWTTILQDKRSGALNEEQAYGLQIIEHSSKHLLALINDILDLSKIEAGKMELLLSSVNLGLICQESLESVCSLAERKHLTLSHSIAPDLDYIQADTRVLKQMLINLLSNAVKFTGQGGKVGFEVYPDTESKNVLFRIWDTGIGIAPEDMMLLFQPFVQIDSSLTRREQGSGLGLVLTHRLASLHSGTITVESNLGQGSSFTISLPLHTLPVIETQDVVSVP